MRLIRLAFVFVLVLSTHTFAWNDTGHRVIASIAYRQLDAQTRKKIADILKKHPAYDELWAAHAGDGADANLNLFWDASIFPDEAGRGRFEEYHRSRAHYVNFRILTEKRNTVEAPLPGENILNSYVAHVRLAEKLMTPDAEKALHLSWIVHQAGDIHQPLHVVTRFSKALPHGDRGGIEVKFPNPRGGGDNLHAYWDHLLGSIDKPAAIEKLADALIAEHPREAFKKELTQTAISKWAGESLAISLSTVYRNLDPNITTFADLPIGYEAEALKVTRTRVALAGYRLADELKRVIDPGK